MCLLCRLAQCLLVGQVALNDLVCHFVGWIEFTGQGVSKVPEATFKKHSKRLGRQGFNLL